MPKANTFGRDDDKGGLKEKSLGVSGSGRGSGETFQIRGKFEVAMANGQEESEAIEVVLREPEEPNLFLERVCQVPMTRSDLMVVSQNAPMEMTFAEAVQRGAIDADVRGGEGREATLQSPPSRNTRARYS